MYSKGSGKKGAREARVGTYQTILKGRLKTLALSFEKLLSKSMLYPNKSSPVRLGLYTQKIVEPTFKARGLMEGRVLTHWPQIVGEKFAQLSLPEKITFPMGKKTEGTLHLSVTSAGSILIQSVQDLILEHVNRFFGYKAVSRLYMTHGLVVTPKTSASSPPPSSADIPAWVHEATETVEDPELRERLASLGAWL